MGLAEDEVRAQAVPVCSDRGASGRAPRAAVQPPGPRCPAFSAHLQSGTPHLWTALLQDTETCSKTPEL